MSNEIEKPFIVDGERMSFDEVYICNTTEIDREEYGTDKYWELFNEDRRGAIEVSIEERGELTEELSELDVLDEGYEIYREQILWEIGMNYASELISSWELYYQYDYELQMGNWEDFWFNNYVALWIDYSSYSVVWEFLKQGIVEFPNNPVKAMIKIPQLLEKSNYITTKLKNHSISRLIPYISDK